MSPMPRVLVCIAPGFEDIEAITPIDVLRRAGCEVVVAGLLAGPITSSRGLTICPDAPLDAIVHEEFDAIVLPGGMPGAAHLRDDPRVIGLLQRHAERNRITAAICAGPIALHQAGLLKDKVVTSHPTVQRDLTDAAEYSEARVVVDGQVITSRGPGTAMEFAFQLVVALCGADKAAEVNAPMFGRIDGVPVGET